MVYVCVTCCVYVYVLVMNYPKNLVFAAVYLALHIRQRSMKTRVLYLCIDMMYW